MGFHVRTIASPSNHLPRFRAAKRRCGRHELNGFEHIALSRGIRSDEHREGIDVVHLERPIVAEVSQRKRLNMQIHRRAIYVRA